MQPDYQQPETERLAAHQTQQYLLKDGLTFYSLHINEASSPGA
jgi:hypothetical protein